MSSKYFQLDNRFKQILISFDFSREIITEHNLNINDNDDILLPFWR
jgi:hypothetical protein